MEIVVDANVVVQASIDAAGLGPLSGHQLLCPPIMRSEAVSVLHELRFRGDVSAELARVGLARVAAIDCEVREPADLFTTAWRIATELGWAKTYDAEYVALASLLGVPLVTLDGRLVRGASRMASIITPMDLA